MFLYGQFLFLVVDKQFTVKM